MSECNSPFMPVHQILRLWGSKNLGKGSEDLNGVRGPMKIYIQLGEMRAFGSHR